MGRETWEEVQARGAPGSGWLVLRISPTSLGFILPQRRTGDATEKTDPFPLFWDL